MILFLSEKVHRLCERGPVDVLSHLIKKLSWPPFLAQWWSQMIPFCSVKDTNKFIPTDVHARATDNAFLLVYILW